MRGFTQPVHDVGVLSAEFIHHYFWAPECPTDMVWITPADETADPPVWMRACLNAWEMNGIVAFANEVALRAMADAEEDLQRW
jgi:hypothetical protein